MANIRLSKRLSEIADMVSEGNRLCDVGCDHAFLPISLVESGRIPSAIAMDVREGPLAIAERNVVEAGLAARIETRLSDGLEMLRLDEADTIVLAGMGGRLMLDILARGIDVARTAKEWVLQPQSEVAEVRQWLRVSGFAVVDEEMVCERGKYYPVLRVGIGEEPLVFEQRETIALTDLFGTILLEKKPPILQEFLKKEDKRIGNILEGLSNIENGRKEELEEEHRMVQLALDYVSR